MRIPATQSKKKSPSLVEARIEKVGPLRELDEDQDPAELIERGSSSPELVMAEGPL